MNVKIGDKVWSKVTRKRYTVGTHNDIYKTISVKYVYENVKNFTKESGA